MVSAGACVRRPPAKSAPIRRSCKIARAAHFVASERPGEAQFCGPIVTGCALFARVHSGNKLIEEFFASAIRVFPSAIPRMHDKNGIVRCAIRTAGIGGTPRSDTFAASFSIKGDVAVDLALKFDVLAVCAVFVFVGAILLGAF